MEESASKKAIIYCFSGTGNTLIAAEKTAAFLTQRGICTDVYRVCTQKSALYTNALTKSDDSIPNDDRVRISEEFGEVPDPNAYDLCGFSFPIHAFNTPQVFLRFVKNLPELIPEKKGMPAFIFKTSGEPFKPNASSSRTLVHFLKKKGFEPGTDVHMLMPYNIMFRYPKEMAKQMYLHTDSMCEKLADQICKEEYSSLRFNPLITFGSYIFRLQWFGAWVNGPMYVIKKAECTGCGLCEKNCPTANIRMVPSKDGSKKIPKMGWKCTMCMNCTMGCPKAAINPGFLTPWKVNPKWNFNQLVEDDSVASNWTDSPDAGYFRYFRKYYSNNK